MDFLKKIGLYLFIILFIVSIYKDLSNETYIVTPNNSPEIEKVSDMSPFNVKRIKVQSGETVLSIVERVNKSKTNHLNIEVIMRDFKIANPNANPYHLKPNTFYYFPIYEST